MNNWKGEQKRAREKYQLQRRESEKVREKKMLDLQTSAL